MSNFKKVFLIILTFLCVIAMTVSCSEKEQDYEDASQTYSDAKEKTDVLNAFCAEMTIEHIFDGHEYVSGLVSDTLVQYDNEEAFVISNSYNTTVELNDGSGIENGSSLYYSDYVMYQKVSDTEKYMSVLDEESETQMAQSYSSVSLDIPAEVFEKSTVTKKDSKTTVTASPSVDKVEEFLSTFVGDMSVYYTPTEDAFEYSYSDIEFGFVVDSNGLFSEITVDYTVKFEAAEGEAAVGIKVAVEYTDTDGSVDIEAPGDLSEYTFYLGEEEKTQEELEAEYMNEVLSLYDSNNNRVADFDKLYVELCIKYGKASVDAIVDAFEMAKLMQE